MVSLEAARRALEAGTIDEALTLALSEWRRTHAPEVADAIDRLDRLARAGFTPPKTRTKVEFQTAWLALAGERSGITTGWLAETLGQRLSLATDYYGMLDPSYAARKHSAFLSRLERLKAHKPDPRLARAAVELLVTAPIPVGDQLAAQLVYGGLLQLVLAMADVRALAPLEELLRAPRAKNVTTRGYLAAALPGVIEKLSATVPRLDEAARAGWNALAQTSNAAPASSSSLDGDALVAQIRAHPDDDSLRLVYADWLLERGEPLGQLIVLQDREARGTATPEEQKRARALLREHKDEWLGPLALVLHGVELERGFLARAELAQNGSATAETWHACTLDERLATLRELRQGRGNFDHYCRFVLSPAVRALASIELMRPSLMETFVSAERPLQLTHVCFRSRPRLQLLERMTKHPSLEGLRVLEVAFKHSQLDATFKDLERSGWPGRLEELRLCQPDVFPGRTPDREALQRHADAMSLSLRRVTLVSMSGQVLLELRA
jgi:uncharacterized protein (TIGR02996 family)